MRKTELAARQFQQLVLTSRTGRAWPTSAARPGRSVRPLPNRHRSRRCAAMSWSTSSSRCCRSTSCSLGIVVLIGLEIAEAGERSCACRLADRAGRRVLRRGLACARTATRSTPFPGQLLGRCDRRCWPRRSCSRWRVPVLLISRDEFDRARSSTSCSLSSLYGVCLLLSADSFLTLFLGLELMSLPVYVLVLLAFRRPESAEAALKYLVLGGTATATLLMGVSLLYGASGSLALDAFARRARDRRRAWRASRVVLIVVAFFLKAAIVPFHAWAPDAYEARRVPVTAYMAIDHQGGRCCSARCGCSARRTCRPRCGSAGVAAAALDRLGQPRRDAPAELSPHDRLLVDRACRIPVLRVARRCRRTIPGGGLLRRSRTG